MSEQFTFQAEIKQLLHLLSHSLYQNREIAVRELVSNASDALDKMRHVALTDEQYRDESPLEIRIEPDADAGVLAICDNGIGMTRDELVENLGTIAHSGSLQFLKSMAQSGKSDSQDLSLIGQFGVGFYSAFMLADKVEVLTRSYREASGWRWGSDGSGTFAIEPAENLPRGTQVRLHLKDENKDFAQATRIKHILEKYSTFVPHPVQLDGERVNDQPPIWVEPRSQISGEQYQNFYRWLRHGVDEDFLWHLHVSSDSPLQFHAVLFCPQSNFELMGFGKSEHGLSLCAKRILVQNDCRELLPEYLRFLHGLVDSADLPLNVSREALQDNTIFRKIRKVLVKRVLDRLAKTAGSEPEQYAKFYAQFGPVLREGVASDFEHRETIGGLLRFRSTNSDDAEMRTSLGDYVQRMPEAQKQIYFLGGPNLATLRSSPNLEIFRRKKLEVLLLTDPVDEFVLAHLEKFDDRKIASIDSADVEIPDVESDSDKSDEAETDQPEPEGFDTVLRLFKDALGEKVVDIRKSTRLTDSPCCLVNPTGGFSAQMEKVLQMSQEGFEASKRIFEINPAAALIRRLSTISANEQHHEFIRNCGRQLFSNALLLDGVVTEPEAMVARTHSMLEELATSRSPIVT